MSKVLRACLLLSLTLAVVNPLFAAVPFEDFESYAQGTLAEDLAVPGVTFDGGGNFEIFQSSGFDHMVDNLLGQNSAGTDQLTMNFIGTQSSATFSWAVRADDTLIVTGFLGASEVLNEAIVGDLAPSIPNFFEQTSTITGSFDSLVLSSTSGDLVAIDNLSSEDQDLQSIVEIPTLAPTSLAILVLGLIGGAIWQLRRKRRLA